jgi:hypothetical protein
MSIGNRQIGWSNESNLLWNISKQLEKLNGVVAATAAGGMLNPTTNYIPFNSGLAFGDSYLVNDTTANVLKTVYSGNDVGLYFDFVNLEFSFGNNYGGDGSLIIDANNQESYLYNRRVFLGSTNNGTQLKIDDFNSTITTQYGGNDIGLKLDFANSQYFFGDNNPNGAYLLVDMNGPIICSSTTLFGSEGIVLDMLNRSYLLGDPGNVNNTYLTIDDTNQRWEMSNNLTEATAGGSASKFLKVFINGVTYKIALLNNA